MSIIDQIAFDQIADERDKAQQENKLLKQRIKRLEEFTNRFLDPDDLGYVVNNYVRDDAREALGRERMEAKP